MSGQPCRIGSFVNVRSREGLCWAGIGVQPYERSTNNTKPCFFQNTEKVDFSYNPLADPKFAFYDHSLVEAVKLNDVPTHRFFRLLSLCHTVMPEEKKEGEDC